MNESLLTHLRCAQDKNVVPKGELKILHKNQSPLSKMEKVIFATVGGKTPVIMRSGDPDNIAVYKGSLSSMQNVSFTNTFVVDGVSYFALGTANCNISIFSFAPGSSNKDGIQHAASVHLVANYSFKGKGPQFSLLRNQS